MSPRRLKMEKNLKKVSLYDCVVKKVGKATILTVLDWLYSGKKPIEENLYKLNVNKKTGLQKHEKDKLNELKEGTCDLEDLDFGLLFVLTQFVCGLKSKEEWRKPKEWGKHCLDLEHDEVSIENNLSWIKEEKNGTSHEHSEEIKQRSQEDLGGLINDFKELCLETIKLAGTNAKKEYLELLEEEYYINSIIEKICEAFENPVEDEMENASNTLRSSSRDTAQYLMNPVTSIGVSYDVENAEEQENSDLMEICEEINVNELKPTKFSEDPQDHIASSSATVLPIQDEFAVKSKCPISFSGVPIDVDNAKEQENYGEQEMLDGMVHKESKLEPCDYSKVPEGCNATSSPAVLSMQK